MKIYRNHLYQLKMASYCYQYYSHLLHYMTSLLTEKYFPITNFLSILRIFINIILSLYCLNGFRRLSTGATIRNNERSTNLEVYLTLNCLKICLNHKKTQCTNNKTKLNMMHFICSFRRVSHQ